MNDIILVLSDQHSKSLGQGIVETPFLEQLGEQAAVFEHAYCNSPLCVPSRSSFLTGRHPADLKIFDNDSSLAGNEPTLAHALGAVGYRTVLAGRMHFKGYDQWHGFDERLVGDITTQFWGTRRTDLGTYQGTLQAAGCQQQYGYGSSPVLEFDKAVTAAAIDVLETADEKPLFLVVGMYAPHFPYVCPEEYFYKYYDKLSLPDDIERPELPCYRHLRQETGPEAVRQMRAAYFGMIENLDRMTGMVWEAWQRRRERLQQNGIFIYTSDHGEQAGKRGIFGKKTLYEDAVRIPLYYYDGCHQGKIDTDVSLIDLTRTILDDAGAFLPLCSGQNLFDADHQPVKIQTIVETDKKPVFLEAVISRRYKLLSDGSQKHLYHLLDDPEEEHDLAADEVTGENQMTDLLAESLSDSGLISQCETAFTEALVKNKLLKQWGQIRQQPESWRFRIPEAAVKPPGQIK